MRQLRDNLPHNGYGQLLRRIWPPITDSFYAEFGRLLQTARRRREKRLTQAELAEAVGLSRSSVANIEMGRQPVQLHLVVKMAEILEVDPGDLIPPQPSSASSSDSRMALEALQQQGASSKLLDRARAHLPSGGN